MRGLATSSHLMRRGVRGLEAGATGGVACDGRRAAAATGGTGAVAHARPRRTRAGRRRPGGLERDAQAWGPPVVVDNLGA